MDSYLWINMVHSGSCPLIWILLVYFQAGHDIQKGKAAVNKIREIYPNAKGKRHYNVHILDLVESPYQIMLQLLDNLF